MNFREASVYVHRKTFRRLCWVAKAKGMVSDALADELLNKALETQFPQLIPAEEALSKVEKEFAESFPNSPNDERHIKLD